MTGGAGYVESHACKRSTTPATCPLHTTAWSGATVGRCGGDLSKWGIFTIAGASMKFLLKYKPAAALHFAAYAYVGESAAEPGRYY